MALRDYLETKGLTQADFAARVGEKQYTISRWCARGIPPHRCVEVHRVTGIPLHELRPDLYPEARS